MGYKNVTLAVQDKWVAAIKKQGIAPVDALLRHFVKETDWNLVVLGQSHNGCAFLVKSEIIGELRITDAIREYFNVKFLLSEDQFVDVVEIKFVDMEKADALALEKGIVAANKINAAEDAARGKAANSEKDARDFTQVVQDCRPRSERATTLEELNLSVRSYNTLKRAGINISSFAVVKLHK